MPTDEELAARCDAGRGLTSAGVRRTPRVREDRARGGDHRVSRYRTTPGPPTCSRTTSRPRCASGTRRRMAEHRAAPRHHHHRAGQRGRQPRRHHVRVPCGRGDRRHRSADVIRAYVIVRDVYRLWPTCGARWRSWTPNVPTAAQTAVLPRGPAPDGPRDAVAAHQPAGPAGRGRARSPGCAPASPTCCRTLDVLFRGNERDVAGCPRGVDRRNVAFRRTSPSGRPGSCTASACSTSSRSPTRPGVT